MLKKLQKKQISFIAGAGICAFLAGVMFSSPQIGLSISDLLTGSGKRSEKVSEESAAKSAVLPLALLDSKERTAELEKIANGSASLERNRARYLLADDLIEQKQGKAALKWLDGLDREYKALSPYILLQKARAHDILGEDGKASDMRQAVLKRYPKEAAAAKSLYLIGLPEYQDKAIAEFPSHPLTSEIIRERLRQNPDQPNLQLLLAKHAANRNGIVPILDQLTQSTANLQPEDWKVIADSYWNQSEYGKAATSYENATSEPRNLYRIGRGYQYGSERERAILAYEQLLEKFPDSQEAANALLRLSDIQRDQQDKLTYLNQLIAAEKHPEQIATGLIKKAKILESSDRSQAQEALKLLLSKYNNTTEVAEYRWKVAKKKAKEKDYEAAWKWAESIPINNPNHILAPRAGFWVGKWATRLGREEEAKRAYGYVLGNFPYSYYAWRSGSVLGLDVGDFNTVRKMRPQVGIFRRSVPPAGSETFKELYILAQDKDAWQQWETEFQNKLQPSVSQQFTEGLIQLARDNYLSGIDKVAKLEDREKPEEKAQFQALSKQEMYWKARYPFPYFPEIQKWSKANDINPFMVVALIRQESRFQPEIRSTVGATGLMQVMPATANWILPQIKADKEDIKLTNPDDNIRLGTWYLDHTHEQYQGNSMLAIASYNAGPGNVSKWLRTLPRDDPDQFVKQIPFNETKNYVRQVFGNYWNYTRLYNPQMSLLVSEYAAANIQFPTVEKEKTSENQKQDS
ncbi:MAG: transglycosylase SLT domain-containing protein [Cyanobacteria bacterium P01_A01_bin.45]